MHDRKTMLLTAGLAFLPLLCFAQGIKPFPWKLYFSGGYALSGMTGRAARKTTGLYVESFFTYYRSTYADAGKRLQAGPGWSAGVIRTINQTFAIGIGIGETVHGGYARIDTLYSALQFRDPVSMKDAGYGRDKFDLRYLVIPLSLYCHPLKRRNIYFILEAWYASLESAEESVNFNAYSKSPQDRVRYGLKLDDDYKQDNWGMSAGAGYEFAVTGHFHVSTQVNYGRGFENLIVKSKSNSDAGAFMQSLNAEIRIDFVF